MKLRISFTIDLTCFAPVVLPIVALFRRAAAWLVRLHASQLHPLAPTGMHRFWATKLANLERRA